MNSKKWIKVWLIVALMIILLVGSFNYIVDPYGIFKTNIIDKPKITQYKKMKLIKAIKTKEIKPSSISLGTSRTENGYDPNHKYFNKPSYNLGTSGGSMYESRLYFENSLKQGNLKKVLLVADFIMFNTIKHKRIKEFETYFTDNKFYNSLFNIDTFKDSLSTIRNTNNYPSIYYPNGQRIHNYFQKRIKAIGHLKSFKINEGFSYINTPNNYRYNDTKQNSFDDFEKVVTLSYEHNIKLDIIFGPSHIRLWEALNYRKSFKQWLQWKKDIVLSVNKIANQKNKQPFRIMDFSVYHPLTAEKVPTNKDIEMKYHWETNHYKNELGLIVLDRLSKDSKYKDFGIELNLSNIDSHLEQQKIKRRKYINIKEHQLQVWGKVKE